MNLIEFAVLAILLVAIVALQLLALARGRRDGSAQAFERLERELRHELQLSAQATRQEVAGHLAQNHAAASQQLDGMRQQIQLHAAGGREEQARSLKRFADTLNTSLATLTESNAQRMLEVRATLEAKIRDLQNDNAKRLEEMRQTVDEKLHATLETRLTESFRQVSDRLEKVHQGLGEMQQLAVGVGDLKRVLTNVKTRGTWGEVQLEMLLEQVLTVDQYAKNVETVRGSNARVEFAIKLPGVVDGGRRCGCPSTPSSRRSSTSACWPRPTRAMAKAWRVPVPNSNAPCAARPRPSARNTWRRRRRPTLQSCSCRPKACTPR